MRAGAAAMQVQASSSEKGVSNGGASLAALGAAKQETPQAHSPACRRTAACVFADKRNPKRPRCSSNGSMRGIRPSTFARKRMPSVLVKVNFNASACNRPSRSSRITTTPGTSIPNASTSFSPAPRSAAVGTLSKPSGPESPARVVRGCPANRHQSPGRAPIHSRRRRNDGARVQVGQQMQGTDLVQVLDRRSVADRLTHSRGRGSIPLR